MNRVWLTLLTCTASAMALAVIETPASGANKIVQTQRKIALTFDDLPMTVVGNDHIAGPLADTQDVMRSLIQQLQSHRATAIGFVNEVKLNVQGERDARAALLEEWLDANLLLGNHGYNHLAFSVVGLAAYEEQFLRGDSITKTLLARRHIDQLYFRPPYMDTGKSGADERAFAAMLAAHRYQLAPITIENYDWMFNASYNDARNRGDKQMMGKVVDAYCQQTEARLKHAEQLSGQTFSREIPLVILMHADRINADHLNEILALMEKRSYRFITIGEALSDNAYKTPDKYVGNQLGSWLDRWQLTFGRPMSRPSGPPPPAWIQAAYQRIAGNTIGH